MRFFLALYALVATNGFLLTYLPQTSNSLAFPQAEAVAVAPASPRPVLPEASLPPPAPKPATQVRIPSPEPGDDTAPAPRVHSAAAIAPEASGGATTVHTVKPGESYGSISYRYLAKSIFMTTSEFEAALRQANPELTGTHLHPGQQVVIPGIEPAPVIERPRPLAKDAEVRAIYLTGWTAGSERGLNLIRRWKEAGGNAICFDIKDFDGLVTVPFDHSLAPRGRSPVIRNLPKFIRFMHQQDLHVIARIALFRDEHIAKTYPELAVKSRRGGGPWRENGKQVWTDPSVAEVQDYNLALARRVAAAGVDEIQFDYVRFPAEGDQDDAKFQFESEAVESEPAEDSANPAAAPAPPRWTRARVITEFLKRAHAEIRPTGVLLSLDVFGVMAWERSVDLARTGQNIAEMARHCEVLSPMIYPSHFFGMDGFKRPGDAPEHFIGSSMARFREITAGTGVVLRPWLQAFAWRTPTYSPDYVVTQVAVSNQKGGVGYLFWNANNNYSKPFAAMPVLMALTRQRETESGKVKETAAILVTPPLDPATTEVGDAPLDTPSSEAPSLEAVANF